jgi:hypothetical protein
MNIPYYISDSIETIFWLKILKFFDAYPDPGLGIRDGKKSDPGSEIRDGKKSDPGSGIRNKHPASTTLNLSAI